MSVYLRILTLCLAAMVPLTGHCAAVPVAAAPGLDITISFYSRVLTREGVLRESRYQEKMLRRPGHVWVARVLPKMEIPDSDGEEHEGHKHFNYVLLPRHIAYDGKEVHVEFVDVHDKAVVNIAPSEYENVNFDGSWVNAFFLIDPQRIAAMQPAQKVSAVAGARWYREEKDGVSLLVLWDEGKQIPLVAETGDRAGTFMRRIEVKPDAALAKHLPWESLRGYAQKEYADFLD